MWRLFRRRHPLTHPPGPASAHGNDRERAARAKRREGERKARESDELTGRGELLAEMVRRALGASE